jgi:hypothetical protein
MHILPHKSDPGKVESTEKKSNLQTTGKTSSIYNYTTQLLHILLHTVEILRHTNNHICRPNKAPLVYDPKAGGKLKDVQGILSNRLQQSAALSSPLLHILRHTVEILRHTNNHICRPNKSPLVYDPKAGGRLKHVQGILSNRPQQSAALSSPAAAHLGVTVSTLEAHKITPDNPMSQGEFKERSSNHIQNI